MTNNLYNLSKEDWMAIFSLTEKLNSMQISKPTFYEKFMNSGLKYNYFSPELKQKLNEFHEKYKDKNYKTISEQWSHTFENDFNLEDHFNIFLLIDNNYHEKSLVNFIEEKIGKKDTFYTINRFFLDDNNASKFHILRKKWRELLEKGNFSINADIVSRIVHDSTQNSVNQHSNTTELMVNLKMLALNYLHNPDIQKLEQYIVKYSKDALFEKKAFEYLEKKNIKLTINFSTIEKIPLINNEKITYSAYLDPEYLLIKYSLSRKNSEIICKEFINYIYKKIDQPLSNTNSFTIQLKCIDLNDYQNKKEIFLKSIANLDIAVNFIKENKLTSVEMADFLINDIDKILMKELLDKNLNEKTYQKKLKI